MNDDTPALRRDRGGGAKRVIYDFGSNNGDDIPYYLKKADLVVAVEANPLLCDVIRERFASEIANGRLAVENFVLTEEEAGDVVFYRHKTIHWKSQFPKPADLTEYEEMVLPSRSVRQIISDYGVPYYIKVDVEHYDQAILRALFKDDIKPPFISAESHSIEVFAILMVLGGYTAFKLVEGRSVSQDYRDHKIATIEGTEIHSFPHHSAGPFGDDVRGDWLSANDFFRLLGAVGLGWKDIHATNTCEARAGGSAPGIPGLPDRSGTTVTKRDLLKILLNGKLVGNPAVRALGRRLRPPGYYRA